MAVVRGALNQNAVLPSAQRRFVESGRPGKGGAGHSVRLSDSANLLRREYAEVGADRFMLQGLGFIVEEFEAA